MKKKALLFTFAIMAFFAACKKDSTEKDTTTTLQGKWHNNKRIAVYYENDKEMDRDESTVEPGELTMEFVKDSVFFSEDGTPGDRYAYTINNGEISLRYENASEHMGFNLVNDAQFILRTEENRTSSTGVRKRYVDEYFFNKE